MELWVKRAITRLRTSGQSKPVSSIFTLTRICHAFLIPTHDRPILGYRDFNQIVQLTIERMASFHGRDLFAPAAGMLARGEPPPGRPRARTPRIAGQIGPMTSARSFTSIITAMP
jgi:hypothetical protein